MTDHVAALYDRHPISAQQVLDKVRAARGSLEGLEAQHLFPYDQDHYGGLAANDALAERARLNPDSLALDVCAGLAGPARYQARCYGSRMVALDFHAGRAVGAALLNRMVGLDGQVSVVRGDAQALPFAAATFDAVLSQEAFLHVPDKSALLNSCRRVLKRGGRLAFSDWIAGRGLSDAERDLMWRGIAAQTLRTVEQYRVLLRDAGFAHVETENLSAEWVPILQERLAMYEGLRQDAIRATGQDPHRDYVAFYTDFVRLVESARLGGVRVTAV
ncbi:MAG: methyltransferase domain-containing protein [Alphaproteobacteria bacterium]